MKKQLLDKLCEPGTGDELEINDPVFRNGEVWEGTLRSRMSGKQFPIFDGIPRFVANDGYCESFGLQWNRFAEVQLDSLNGSDYSRRRFERELGWSSSQVQGRWVLDAGCGCGRFAEIAAELGAEVIALDYTSAIDAAASNLRGRPNVHFIQGDLLRPPIKPRSLMFAYSIGVLQHTPDPHASLKSIVSLVAPGGNIGITMYGKRWYTFLYSKYLMRSLTRRLAPKTLLMAIEKVMPVLFPLTDVLFRVPLLGKVAQFMIPIANYVHKSEFTYEQRYQEAILDTFDMLSPAFDRPLVVSEVEQTLNGAGVDRIQIGSRIPVNVTGLVTTPGVSKR